MTLVFRSLQETTLTTLCIKEYTSAPMKETDTAKDTANIFCVLSGHVSQTCNHLHALITIAPEVAQAIVLSNVSVRCIETLRALTAVAMYAIHLCYCRFARGQSPLFNFLQRYSEMENRGIGFPLH